MQASSPGKWMRLNADGLLLVALSYVAALDLFKPDATDLAQAAGYIPLSFYVWTTCYLLGGTSMLVGFAASRRHRMPWELTGRLLLCTGYVIETWRVATIFGYTSKPALIHAVVCLILITLTWMRASMLLNKKGTVIVIGGSNGGKK